MVPALFQQGVPIFVRVFQLLGEGFNVDDLLGKGKIGGKEITEFNYNFTVISPERWSPDYPNQYVMRTEIISNGVVLDEYIPWLYLT